MKATGTKVVIEKLEADFQEKEIGGIVIPKSRETDAGDSVIKGKVVSLGKDAKAYGVKEGDVVLYDRASVFYDNTNPVITNIENIILIEVKK